MASPVVVAIIQAEVQPTVEATLALSAELAREARGQGARLLAFPEVWIPGYPAWLDTCRDVALWDHPPVKAAWARMAAESVAVPGPACDRLAAIARENDAVVVVGATERVEEGPGRGTLYNTLLTFGPDGSLLNHHRKLMPTYTERLVWGQGDAAGLRAVDTPVGRVGGLICWEHWMPLARQALHDSGENIHVAVWPTVHEMHQVASRAHAFEGRCFTLACGSLMRARGLPPGLEPHPGKVRGPDTLVLRGGSAIIGPNGMFVTEPVFDRTAVLVAELDLERCRAESMTLDVTGHYARPDALALTVHRGDRVAGAARSTTSGEGA